MYSMQELSIIQCAVNICNNRHLKREILWASGSDFDLSTRNLDAWRRKDAWNEMVEKKASEIIKLMPCPKPWVREIMKLVIPIGMGMLTWAVYHERTIGFSRDISIHALEPSLFTQEGLVDRRRVAEKLMEGEILNSRQICRLASIYCFGDNIKDTQTTEERGNWLLSGLKKFWTYFWRVWRDNFQGGETVDAFRLEGAVASGSKEAVEFCLEDIVRSEKFLRFEALQEGAIHAVRCSLLDDDLDHVFSRNRRYNYYNSWVPSAYYIDILCFILSKMTEDQERKFLEEDTETIYDPPDYTERSRVLEWFLRWPYQVHFMKKARLMWEFLPENNYVVLLLMICDKIGLRCLQDIQSGEEKSFDYRDLLEEFWKESPERYKRYVLRNRPVTYRSAERTTVKSGTGLLTSLLTLQCFNDRDKEAIRLILAEATDTEKQDIMSDRDLGDTCVELAKEEKWEQLSVLSHSFASLEEENKFKSEFFRDWRGQRVFIASLQGKKWNAFLSFAEWCALPQEQLKELKKELINSTKVQDAFKDLLLKKRKVALADIVLKWCFSSEEEIKSYKKDLVFIRTREEDYKYIFSQEETNLIDKFVKWGLSSQQEIEEFKVRLLNDMGENICLYIIYMNHLGAGKKFKGNEWGRVEEFLNWCLLTEQDVCAFKKNTILEKIGGRILSDLIISNQYEEAEKFFAWLDLSNEEMKVLKQKALQYYADDMMGRATTCIQFIIAMRYAVDVSQTRALSIFKEMVNDKIERFLKFCLSEREAVIKFRKEFEEAFLNPDLEEFRKHVVEHFCLMLDQRLIDIDSKVA